MDSQLTQSAAATTSPASAPTSAPTSAPSLAPQTESGSVALASTSTPTSVPVPPVPSPVSVPNTQATGEPGAQVEHAEQVTDVTVGTGAQAGIDTACCPCDEGQCDGTAKDAVPSVSTTPSPVPASGTPPTTTSSQAVFGSNWLAPITDRLPDWSSRVWAGVVAGVVMTGVVAAVGVRNRQRFRLPWSSRR